MAIIRTLRAMRARTHGRQLHLEDVPLRPLGNHEIPVNVADGKLGGAAVPMAGE